MTHCEEKMSVPKLNVSGSPLVEDDTSHKRIASNQGEFRQTASCDRGEVISVSVTVCWAEHILLAMLNLCCPFVRMGHCAKKNRRITLLDSADMSA